METPSKRTLECQHKTESHRLTSKNPIIKSPSIDPGTHVKILEVRPRIFKPCDQSAWSHDLIIHANFREGPVHHLKEHAIESDSKEIA